MGNMYVTYMERPEEVENYNRYDGYKNPYVLHNGWQWHLGRFPKMEKLMRFIELAGLTMELVEEKENAKGGVYKRWSVDCDVDDHNSFWNTGELPREAKRFVGLSNGSLVECYLYNDGKTLHIYRPNPNAKEVYKPLSTEECIRYCKENGYV